jgi:hypothetical protein
MKLFGERLEVGRQSLSKLAQTFFQHLRRCRCQFEDQEHLVELKR